MSYSDELKHPKWQRRRLEILSRADFKCEKCGADDRTLHVHHKKYRTGAAPWEYSDEELVSLCEGCHSDEHEKVLTRAQAQAIAQELEETWRARFEELSATLKQVVNETVRTQHENLQLLRELEIVWLREHPEEAAAIAKERARQLAAIRALQ